MLNFNWLANMPESWGKFLIILTLVIPLIFALTLKRSYIYLGAKDTKWWRNLKIWVLIIVVLQISIYLYF